MTTHPIPPASALLACPFCGGPAVIRGSGRLGNKSIGRKVGCEKCHYYKEAKTLRFTAEWLDGKLTEWWNTRATPSDARRAGLIEQLAALEHQQWMAWASTVAEKEPISDERRQRWMSCMVPYSALSEEMKEHDRVWARKVAAIIAAELGAGEGRDGVQS